MSIMEGVQSWYNYKGKLVEDFEIKDNKKTGMHRIFYENGRVAMVTTLINGIETGTRKSFKNSDILEIISETDFQNDVRLERRYYKKGKLVKVLKD